MTAREPITVTAKELCAMSGLCRDKVFELIRTGVIDSFRCGAAADLGRSYGALAEQSI